MVQIRNMPENVHRIAKIRAAEAGMSLSDYLLAEVKRSLEMPTNAELIARLEKLPRIKTTKSSAEMIREERDRR